MPVEHLNGVELYYDTLGTGDTVVFTHGSWGDGDGWLPTVDVLQPHYRSVIWDRRGHSRSMDDGGQGSIAQDVDDLVALIEHVADGPVHAVGNSFGSVITYRLVAVRPDLLKSAAVHEPAALALLSASTDPEVKAVADPFFSELGMVQKLLEQGKGREGAAYFIDNVALGPGNWETYPEESMAVLEANAPTFLDELQEWPYGRLDVDGLVASDIPLLLTVGTESPEFLKVVAQLLSEQVPDIRVEWIEGSGHIPHATHPGPLAAVLEGFWRSAS